MLITETITDFSKLASEQKKCFFKKIWIFDQQIFPNSSVEEIYNFVHDVDAVSVKVIHYYHEGKLIGQNVLPILKLSLDGKPIFVLSSRAGILPAYRSGHRTLNSAIRVVLNHQIRHLTIPLWFVTTVMQPKVYTIFASRSHNFFPRAERQTPQDYLQVLNVVQQRQHEVQKRREDIFVHPVVMPKVTLNQLMCLRSKATKHINFFMQHVPDYFDGMGLMCVCKLDFKTIFEMMFNLSFDRHVY